MDYRDKVFIAVAENMSFSKAAEELFISQPAVTKHIKELESKLNTTLFDRKGNRIYLTRSGQLTYDFLKKIKLQYREMEFQLGRLNGSFKGTLRMGASSTVSQYVIPAVVAAFHKKYPEINFYLFNGNSFEMEQKLLKNEIDLALVENESSHANLKYIDFLQDEIVVVAGSNSLFSKKKNLSLSDMKKLPIVLREKGSGTLEVIKNTLLKHKINLETFNILIHLGSTEAIKNFLPDFDGIALLSKKSIEKELLLKNLMKLNVKNLVMERKFRIAFRQGNIDTIPGLFSDFLLHYNF